LGWTRGLWGSVLRVTLVAVAAGGVALTVYGWWDEPTPSPRRPVEARVASPSSAAAAVERYFEYRADDPVRALRLLAPEVHLAHGLTLVRLLGLPPLAP